MPTELRAGTREEEGDGQHDGAADAQDCRGDGARELGPRLSVHGDEEGEKERGQSGERMREHGGDGEDYEEPWRREAISGREVREREERNQE